MRCKFFRSEGVICRVPVAWPTSRTISSYWRMTLSATRRAFSAGSWIRQGSGGGLLGGLVGWMVIRLLPQAPRGLNHVLPGDGFVGELGAPVGETDSLLLFLFWRHLDQPGRFDELQEVLRH